MDALQRRYSEAGLMVELVPSLLRQELARPAEGANASTVVVSGNRGFA